VWGVGGCLCGFGILCECGVGECEFVGLCVGGVSVIVCVCVCVCV